MIKKALPKWVKSQIIRWRREDDERLKECRIMGHQWRMQGSWDYNGANKQVFTCAQCNGEKLK